MIKDTVTDMLPFAEALALMKEYTDVIPWVGSVPTLEETQHLAEEETEAIEDAPSAQSNIKV